MTGIEALRLLKQLDKVEKKLKKTSISLDEFLDIISIVQFNDTFRLSEIKKNLKVNFEATLTYQYSFKVEKLIPKILYDIDGYIQLAESVKSGNFIMNHLVLKFININDLITHFEDIKHRAVLTEAHTIRKIGSLYNNYSLQIEPSHTLSIEMQVYKELKIDSIYGDNCTLPYISLIMTTIAYEIDSYIHPKEVEIISNHIISKLKLYLKYDGVSIYNTRGIFTSYSSVDDDQMSLGLVRLFRILDINFTDTNNWPYENNIIEIINQKLYNFRPSSSMWQKLHLMGYSGYNINDIKLNSSQLVQLSILYELTKLALIRKNSNYFGKQFENKPLINKIDPEHIFLKKFMVSSNMQIANNKMFDQLDEKVILRYLILKYSSERPSCNEIVQYISTAADFSNYFSAEKLKEEFENNSNDALLIFDLSLEDLMQLYVA